MIKKIQKKKQESNGTRIETIKSDIEFIKGGIKKKVDYEEFVVLERRLTLLEAKTRR